MRITSSQLGIAILIAVVPAPLSGAEIQLPTPPTLKPKVLCGMVLLPGDPKIDPKIRAQTPARGIKPTIRTVTPDACASTSALRPAVPPTQKQKSK